MQRHVLLSTLTLCAALAFSPIASATTAQKEGGNKKATKNNKEPKTPPVPEAAKAEEPAHPLVGQIETAIQQNQLIEPAGLCAWDLYQVLVKNVPSESRIKPLGEKLLNALSQSGFAALTLYTQGSNRGFTRDDWTVSQQCTLRLRQLKPAVKEYKLADLFYQGMISLADKQPSIAESILRQGIKEDEKAAYLHNALGRALSDQKRDEEALAEYNKAIALAPQWTYPLVNAALKYLRKGNLDLAQKLALNAINANITDVEAHAINGAVNASYGNYEEALREYDFVTKQRPNSAADHITYGRLLIEAGNYATAETILQRAVQINPLDGRAQLYLSIATKRRASATFELALDRVKESQVQATEDVALQLAVADAAKEQGNLGEVIDAYRAVIKLEPWQINLRMRLANTLNEADRLPEAVEEYRALIKLNPNIKEALNGLAVALRKSGDKKEALLTYRKALTIDPTYLVARLNLAYLLQETGELEAAAAEYRAVLNADPGNQAIITALKEVESKIAAKSAGNPANGKSQN